MKTALLLLATLVAASSVNAQVYRPQLRHGHGGHGHRPLVVVRHVPGYWHGPHGFSYGFGIGYRGGYRSPLPGYYPGYDYGYYPYADYRTASPASAAAGGLWLGALAGGIIGHNSGAFRHDAWRGAAWGAGLGWLVGSAVDANRRVIANQTAATQAYANGMQTQAQPPQQVTVINNYYNAPVTPMSGANSLFGR